MAKSIEEINILEEQVKTLREALEKLCDIIHAERFSASVGFWDEVGNAQAALEATTLSTEEIGPSDPSTQQPTTRPKCRFHNCVSDPCPHPPLREPATDTEVCPCEIVRASMPVVSILNPNLCTPCFNTGLGEPSSGAAGERRARRHSSDCTTPRCVDGKIQTEVDNNE